VAYKHFLDTDPLDGLQQRMLDLFNNSDEFIFTPELLYTKGFFFLRIAIIQGNIEPLTAS
jgi:hypothetical protein